MANSKKSDHILAFAAGHRNTVLPTFDAFTALFRAQNLLEDVERLAEANTEDRGRSSALDITDYYAAGYVTCLEWHARSRQADLLTFMPELIQPNMMSSIRIDSISQIHTARVTLADLIGASTKINNLKAYKDVFDQIWSAFKITIPLASILTNSARLGGQDQCLYELFERRHSLIHEIGIGQVGSYILRDTWTFEQAAAHGRMIVGVISEVEQQISKFAPDDFPNKLDHDGLPQDRKSVLARQIADVEGRIAIAMQASGVGEVTNASNSSALYFKAQTDFLDAALSEVPKRHYDPTPGLVEMLYRQRLEQSNSWQVAGS